MTVCLIDFGGVPEQFEDFYIKDDKGIVKVTAKAADKGKFSKCCVVDGTYSEVIVIKTNDAACKMPNEE